MLVCLQSVNILLGNTLSTKVLQYKEMFRSIYFQMIRSDLFDLENNFCFA